MNVKWTVFGLGLVVGVAVGALVAILSAGNETDDSGEKEIAKLRREVDRLSREAEERIVPGLAGTLPAGPPAREDGDARLVSELAAEPATETRPEPEAPPEVTSGGLTDDELEKALRDFGSVWQGIMTGGGDEARKRMAEILAKGGPGTIARILAIREEVSDLGQKLVLSHALAQTNDPEALAALQAVVRDRDLSFMERRLAMHGLTFSTAEGLETFYSEIARNDPDVGTRANAAYGMALRNDEGIELYAKTVDEAFERKDSAAIQYLGGFMLLGKRAAPAVRQRIRTIKDPQARLLMIHILENGKDPDSIPVLREVAADPEASEDVRNAAEKAAAKIAQPD